MTKRFNERGEIIRGRGSDGNQYITQTPAAAFGSSRSSFQWISVVSSMILYAIIGLLIASQQAGAEAVLGLGVGAAWGGAGTAIWNATKGKTYAGKPIEYVYSVGIPAGAAIAVAGSVAIVIIWIAISVLAGG